MLTTMNLTDLALHNGAQQKTSELGALIDFLRPHQGRMKTILEIGSRKGGTLVVWMLIAAPDATIISLDLPFGLYGGGDFTADLNNATRFRQGTQQISFIRGDSHAPQSKVEVEKLLAGRTIDVLFIDGDHSYAGVKQDYDIYSPFVADGGFVLFHDILFHNLDTACQVDKFWNEVKVGKFHREFIDVNHTLGNGAWGGIGIIRVDQPVAVTEPGATQMAGNDFSHR
jgi:cephalosporin hydroxylase